MEIGEEDRRVNVALMISAEDDGTSRRHVLETGHAAADPRQEQSQAHASVTQDVEDVAPAEGERQQQTGGRGEQHVEGDADVRGERPDGGDERHHGT